MLTTEKQRRATNERKRTTQSKRARAFSLCVFCLPAKQRSSVGNAKERYRMSAEKRDSVTQTTHSGYKRVQVLMKMGL